MICSRCKQTAESLNAKGLCKSCVSTASRHTYWRQRVAAIRHYSADPAKPACSCCGEKKLEFLTIQPKTADRPPNLSRLEPWLVRNNYPDGFRVLCHNCRGAIQAYGYCPHELYTGEMTEFKIVALQPARVNRTSK